MSAQSEREWQFPPDAHSQVGLAPSFGGPEMPCKTSAATKRELAVIFANSTAFALRATWSLPVLTGAKVVSAESAHDLI